MELITLLFFIAFGIALYFAPYLVAIARAKRNSVPILLVNIFLGWTVLGWFGALIWSFMHDAPEPQA